MSLKDDINKTIEYAKSFGCVLTKQQIVERLIGSTNHKLQIPRNKQAPNHKLQKAQELATKLLIKFPNILFIGVTGSVAAEFPKENDDIDLFIIVRNNTLWITRFWVRLFVILNRISHRKYRKPEHKDEFCFNMWLDESGLELPQNRQNLRNAVDMILMKKIYDKDNTYARFLRANGWAKKWVATPYYHKLQITNSKKQTITNNQITNHKLLNLIYFIFQYLYLKLKGQRDTVDLHRAMWGKGEYNNSNGYE